VAEIKPFLPVKLICGIYAVEDGHFEQAEIRLAALHGPLDGRSPRFPFTATDYYEPEMGSGLRRSFLSFARLIDPTALAGIKIRTNRLEDEMAGESGAAERRLVNLDPGYLTRAALIMATSKDFSHRIPLQGGIYAHLEFLFTKTGIRTLEWTYPDFHQAGYQEFFLDTRKTYLSQLRLRPAP
jgi:hypothetical protein